MRAGSRRFTIPRRQLRNSSRCWRKLESSALFDTTANAEVTSVSARTSIIRRPRSIALWPCSIRRSIQTANKANIREPRCATYLSSNRHAIDGDKTEAWTVKSPSSHARQGCQTAPPFGTLRMLEDTLTTQPRHLRFVFPFGRLRIRQLIATRVSTRKLRFHCGYKKSVLHDH